MGTISHDDATFNIDINIDNLGKSFKDIEGLSRAIEVGTRKGMQEVSERVREMVYQQLSNYGLLGSNLAQTIRVDFSEDVISVYSTAEYAKFVEFGTGIVGSYEPHPKPWAYDINGHDWEGWFYKGDDGKRHWTAGQRSHPFMYNSWLWASRSARQIIDKNIRAEIVRTVGVK